MVPTNCHYGAECEGAVAILAKEERRDGATVAKQVSAEKRALKSGFCLLNVQCLSDFPASKSVSGAMPLRTADMAMRGL